MNELLLLLALAAASVGGATKAISGLIDNEERYQSQLLLSAPPPKESSGKPELGQPDFTLPTAWGGPPPGIEGLPESSMDDLAFPPVTAPMSTSANRFGSSGSAVLVTNEPGQNRGRTGAEPGAEPGGGIELASRMADLIQMTPFPTVGAFGTDEYELFCLLKAARRNQTDTIRILYGCSKNNSARYHAARERYLSLRRTYVETNWSK